LQRIGIESIHIKWMNEITKKYICWTSCKIVVNKLQKVLTYIICWQRDEMPRWHFICHHYNILCLFAKGQTKNLKGLRRKNKKPEGFAKQKQLTIFAMWPASQFVLHHPSQIYSEPLIIAALLRHIRQTKFYDPLNVRPP
jgi:hypothetical protein